MNVDNFMQPEERKAVRKERDRVNSEHIARVKKYIGYVESGQIGYEQFYKEICHAIDQRDDNINRVYQRILE